MNPRIAFPAVLLSAALTTAAGGEEKAAPHAAGWRPTRTTRADYFPADDGKTVVETSESRELFPGKQTRAAEPRRITTPAAAAVRRLTVGAPDPAAANEAVWRRTVSRSTARHVFPLKSGRPLTTVVPAAQPTGVPAAPGVGEEGLPVPPGPAGGASVVTPMVPGAGAGGVPPTPSGQPMYEGQPMVDPGAPQMVEVGDVFADGVAMGGCPCQDGVDDWCKRHCWEWCHSTCDMPLHVPYYPKFHGYYYFLPYNYNHVLEHKQIVPMWNMDAFAPYETTGFMKWYEDVLGDEAHKPATEVTVGPLTPEREKLPDLEELLEGRHDIDIPRGRPELIKPPAPGKGYVPPPPLPKSKAKKPKSKAKPKKAEKKKS